MVVRIDWQTRKRSARRKWQIAAAHIQVGERCQLPNLARDAANQRVLVHEPALRESVAHR